jgi:hypothetical protein
LSEAEQTRGDLKRIVGGDNNHEEVLPKNQFRRELVGTQLNAGKKTAFCWEKPGTIVVIFGACLIIAILIWLMCNKKEESYYYGYSDDSGNESFSEDESSSSEDSLDFE